MSEIKKREGKYWCNICSNKTTNEYIFNSMVISLCKEHEASLVDKIEPNQQKIIDLQDEIIKKLEVIELVASTQCFYSSYFEYDKEREKISKAIKELAPLRDKLKGLRE